VGVARGGGIGHSLRSPPNSISQDFLGLTKTDSMFAVLRHLHDC